MDVLHQIETQDTAQINLHLLCLKTGSRTSPGTPLKQPALILAHPHVIPLSGSGGLCLHTMGFLPTTSCQS